MKVFATILILFIFACSGKPLQHTEEDQTEVVVSTICVPIGLNSEQLDLCANNLKGYPEYYQTNHYYLSSKSGDESVYLGGGFSTYGLLVSPSRRYMVEEVNAGEGHGVFSVVDLDDVRTGKKPECCGWTEAYPDGFWGLEWQEDVLLFETGVDLLAEKKNLDPELVYRYRMYPAENCRLEQAGEPGSIKE